MEYPKRCELCGYDITDQYDLIWHGHGNCIPIEAMLREGENDPTKPPLKTVPGPDQVGDPAAVQARTGILRRAAARLVRLLWKVA